MMTSNIGEIIRFRRERCGLSQKKLAEMSYIDKKTISYIESGRTAKPCASTIKLLSDALDRQDAIIAEKAARLGI